MPVIRISPTSDDSLGLLDGPFTIEVGDADPQSPVVPNVVQFVRWVASGMSFYGSAGGVENSSLFKSYAAECFEELTREHPAVAADLTNLVVICDGLPASLAQDQTWRLHRAILAT
jgi:hypothetical protein